MVSDLSGDASDLQPAIPNPFSQLSRFDNLRTAVEPLAAEFWALREPLKNALIALEEKWGQNPRGCAAVCLAAGDELRKAGLSTFPAEMANALKPDAAPTPQQVAEQAAWCLLAAAVTSNTSPVNELLANIVARSAICEEFAEALLVLTETCLTKWRCASSQPFIDRLSVELARLGLEPTAAMHWFRGGNTGLSSGARRALSDWLHSLWIGQPIAMVDPASPWELETSETEECELLPPAALGVECEEGSGVQTLKEAPPPLPASGAQPQPEAEATNHFPTAKRNSKRSTERGEGRAKLIAALTKHHQYADESCLNTEPVGNNELARLAGVSESTASAFFSVQFNGHVKYRSLCQDAGKLALALKLLNGEFSPYLLYSRRPPNEDDRDDE